MLLARVTTILPRYRRGNGTLYVLSACISHTAVSLRTVEAVKLDRLGLNFLAVTRLGRLKGKCDGNKEVYIVDTISNNA